MNNRKNVIIYDTDEFELIPFIEGVNNVSPVKFELYQRSENIELNKHRSGKKDELIRYINYFLGGWSIFFHRSKYDHVICWQQFYALTYGFYCSIFHIKSTCQVIACNYTYKEKKSFVKKTYFWFMKKCLSGGAVRNIHILSELYADRVCKELDYDRNRVIITPFGILDEYDKYSKLDPPEGFSKNGFFLAIGRSNRDYDFLQKVWEKIDFPLVIVSDTYYKGTNNPNITIRHDVSAEDQYCWINNCKANILCLDDENTASGDTVLLSAMSLAKINIVSKPSTLAEMYVNDKKNGLTVEKNVEKFREVIHDIINDKYEYIGNAARQSFLDKYSRTHLGEEIGKYIK